MSNKKRNLSARELVEANRDKMLAWNDEGKSYFWMAGSIGLNDRNAPAVSKWFMAQGIRRKPAKECEG